MTSSLKDESLQTFSDDEIESDIGFYQTMFRLQKAKDEVCIPAIVTKIDDKTGRVTVKPLVNRMKQMRTELKGFERGNIELYPYKIFHGGFQISIPCFIGDTGWIVAGDRDSYTAIKKNSSILKEDQGENYGDNEGPQDPDSLGFGRYSFGFFIPCSFSAPRSADRDWDGKLVISNADAKDDGKSAYITIDRNGEIVIKNQKSSIVIGDEKTTISRSDGQVSAVLDKSKIETAPLVTIVSPTYSTEIDPSIPTTDSKFREIEVVTDVSKDGTEVVVKKEKVFVLADAPHDQSSSSFACADP